MAVNRTRKIEVSAAGFTLVVGRIGSTRGDGARSYIYGVWLYGRTTPSEPRFISNRPVLEISFHTRARR